MKMVKVFFPSNFGRCSKCMRTSFLISIFSLIIVFFTFAFRIFALEIFALLLAAVLIGVSLLHVISFSIRMTQAELMRDQGSYERRKILLVFCDTLLFASVIMVAPSYAQSKKLPGGWQLMSCCQYVNGGCYCGRASGVLPGCSDPCSVSIINSQSVSPKNHSLRMTVTGRLVTGTTGKSAHSRRISITIPGGRQFYGITNDTGKFEIDVITGHGTNERAHVDAGTLVAPPASNGHDHNVPPYQLFLVAPT